MEPAVIAVIPAGGGQEVARTIEVPWAGPHGLDIDPGTGCLYCACDAGQLAKLDPRSGTILASAELAGVPDVIFLNVARRCVYVAVGDPGVLQVFDADTLALTETVPTEKGAHTLGFDETRQKVYAFLPQTHRAAAFLHA
jgi:DNA-binding beta-propeller fold protein YncE